MGGGGNGERFGRYLLLERLGVGGMATVHRAKTRGVDGFETTVAVKRILPHLAEDQSFVASFVREAKLAALLHHPNIARINELGRIDGAYFMAMEYVCGHTLLEVFRWERVIGPPPIDVIVSLLTQLCEALDYAHTLADDLGEPLGIVHRDLSPSNLIVEHSGYLKVIDFGIAKATPAELRTESGQAKGKQGYMSPEALRAKGVDHRSDVYSTGVIAHELLTGKRLFKVKDEYETLERIMHGHVEPPSMWNPRCPPELDAIVRRALARDPEERWQSAGEMRDALEDMALQLALRPTNRAVSDWISQASAERPVLVRNDFLEAAEFPVLPVTTPTPSGELDLFAADQGSGRFTPIPLTPVTPMAPLTPATPTERPAATQTYVVLETSAGRSVTMLEGPDRKGADLRTLLHSTTPMPSRPTRWPEPGDNGAAAPPSPIDRAAPATSWRRRDTRPPGEPYGAVDPRRAVTERIAPSSPSGWIALVVIGCVLVALAFYLSW